MWADLAREEASCEVDATHAQWADPAALFLHKAQRALEEEGADPALATALRGDGGAAGRRRDAAGPAASTVSIEGALLKKTATGAWAPRHFSIGLRGGGATFLVYRKRKTDAAPLGGIDLGSSGCSVAEYTDNGARCIRVSGLSGTGDAAASSSARATTRTNSIDAARALVRKGSAVGTPRTFELRVDLTPGAARGPTRAQWRRTIATVIALTKQRELRAGAATKKGCALLFAMMRGSERTAAQAAEAEALGYHPPQDDDIVALYAPLANLYATAAARGELKLKPQGRLLDPRCLFRVTLQQSAPEDYNRIALQSVTEKLRAGIAARGAVKCSFPTGAATGTVHADCSFTAVVVRRGESDHVDVGNEGEDPPEGVQVKLRNDNPARRGSSRWLAKTARAKKQRLRTVDSRAAATVFEVLLIRRDGALHPPAALSNFPQRLALAGTTSVSAPMFSPRHDKGRERTPSDFNRFAGLLS
jgi:hypothetical protein